MPAKKPDHLLNHIEVKTRWRAEIHADLKKRAKAENTTVAALIRGIVEDQLVERRPVSATEIVSQDKGGR